MYSAELGRFISKDPKGYVDGMNLYAYVKNNPLRFVDPMGTTSRVTSEDSVFNYTYTSSFSNDYSVSYDDSSDYGNSRSSSNSYDNVGDNNIITDDIVNKAPRLASNDTYSKSISDAWDSVSNSVSDSFNEVKQSASSLLDGKFSLTVGGGGQSSALYGMSTSGAAGGFVSLDYNNGKVSITRGLYTNAEHGAGATATGASASGGGEVFISNSNHKSALNGGYLNNGVSGSAGLIPLSAGIDVSTTAPDKNGKTTQTFTLNISGSTPKAGGHSRLGYGKTFNEKTTTYDIEKLLGL